MNNTIIKISRSKYIEINREIAIIRLDTKEHLLGQLVVIRYYKTENEKTTTDSILAVGIKDGVGRDCYSIVSTGQHELINDVLYELPDVSSLVNNELYLCFVNDVWNYVYLEGVERQIEPISESDKVFLNISTNLLWFYHGGKLREQGDMYTREEIDALVISEAVLEQIRKDIDENKKLIESLNLNMNAVNLTINSLSSDVSNLTTQTENNTTEIDNLKSIVEQLSGGTPLLLSVVNQSSNLFLTGTFNNITLSISVSRGGVVLTEDCNIFINDTLVELNESGEIILPTNTTTIFRVKAVLKSDSDIISSIISITINYGYIFYWGTIPKTDWEITELNVKSLESSVLSYKKSIDCYFNLSQQRSVFSSPKIYGLIRSIIDANGFNYVTDYDISEITVDGIEYYVYVKTSASTINNFKQTFNY